MSVSTELDRINTTISNQATLLSELKTILSAKGAANGQVSADWLPSFLHRLEFQQFTLSSAGNLHETSYVIGSDYNAGRPNFAIGWTDGAVSGTNEVIQFVHWTDYEAPYEKISYIYANDYGAFTSYAECVYLADANGTGRATIQLYSPPDIATSSCPGTNFTFAANVTYNLIIGKFKDMYNE